MASVTAIAYFTLTPAPGQPGGTFLCLVCGSRGGVDSVLNLLLFVPLGAALASLGVRPRSAVAGMALFSACIEATQFVALSGRDATLGDIIMNTVGGALGVVLACSAHGWLRPPARIAARACLAWSALWLAGQAVASFSFAPSLPDARYHGQLARAFASMATFKGAILDARIGATVIPDGLITNSADVRALLARRSPVTALVVPAGRTQRLAPIVRIADDRREELVLLAQDGSAAVFGLRTGASVFRLRPPLFRLDGALRGAADPRQGGAGAAVRLRASYGPVVHMRADRSDGSASRDIAARVGLAWTLVLPQQWYIEGTRTEAVITWLWVAAGLIPLGFWMASVRARGADGSSVWPVTLIALATVLACGLWLLPRWFGIAPASLAQWIAAAAGLTAGYLAARGVRGSAGGRPV